MNPVRRFTIFWGRGIFQKFLVVLLALLSTTLGGILYADSGWLERGAWRGYYDLEVSRSIVEEHEGRLWLLNEGDREGAFDITGSRFDPQNLLGNTSRYPTPGLFDAQFEPPEESYAVDVPAQRVIYVVSEGTMYLYPTAIMRSYRVVNGVANGVPVAIMYSFTGKLGSVYESTYEGRVHHFGAVGSLYRHDFMWGGEAVQLFFDWETESIWWPPGGKAMSGLMQDVPMKLYDRSLWGHNTMQRAIDDAEARGLKVQILMSKQDVNQKPEFATYSEPPSTVDRFGWGPAESRPPRWEIDRFLVEGLNLEE